MIAQRIGATTIEFPGDSHIGGFTIHAKEFTRLIDRGKAARAYHQPFEPGS